MILIRSTRNLNECFTDCRYDYCVIVGVIASIIAPDSFIKGKQREEFHYTSDMDASKKNQGGTISARPGRGITLGVCCYCLWGLLPLFWKLLDHVSPLEILAHRLLWSSVFLVALCLLMFRRELLDLLRQRRALLILGGAGLIITANWGFYIYAVNSGNILQASLGYYINPLFSILLGVVFFKERLTLIQKIATGLAAAGVLYFIFDYGSFPWIALFLAASFALYGMLKKYGGYPAVPAMTIETTIAAPLAVAFVAAMFLIPSLAETRVFLTSASAGSLDALAPTDTILLIVSGALTALPLVLFASAANSIPYSWLGFLQYLSPTLTLLLGVFVYREAFTHAHTVCFALIWAGLALVATEVAMNSRRKLRQLQA